MSSKMTPMMKQYFEIKKKYKDEILFFRMGDFYEMFFDDAVTGSKILDIALTSRQNDVPMCGLPYHAADNYIARLIKAGKRVAICEQLESTPSQGTIVKRDVVRVITPGTLIESHLLQSDDNNFLASVIIQDNQIGMAFIDISTGDFFLSSIDKSIELFRGDIVRFNPREIVLKESSNSDDEIFISYLKNRDISIYRIDQWLYDMDFMENIICDTFNISGTKGLGLINDIDIITAGSILQYINETQKRSIDYIKHPQKISSTDKMTLDDSTISNLELIQNQQDGTKNRTLFSVLNLTKTAMGRRTLERNILQPLLLTDAIEKRLDIIQFFTEYQNLSKELQIELKSINDVERLLSRFHIGRLFPANFIAMKDSINSADRIKKLLKDQPGNHIDELYKSIPELKKLKDLIESKITPEPAISPEQGRVIKSGANSELDHLYEIKTNGKNWIINYQEEERKLLKISTLKIKYNRVLGYYIEVSKGQTANVPDSYFRKQTLVNAERYTTEKLQKFESEILSSHDKILEIEKSEIDKLRQSILKEQKKIQNLSESIGKIDFYISLATVAIENNFVRPDFNDENITKILKGRHPIVEKYYTKEIFIPNDIELDDSENIIKLITGPNMAGKSTYIRMYAIIQLIAQIGSFIPAESATLSIVDRIFTRIGASDNISRGESTFLVEMNETANILNNATNKSLIIMDEVGRGTSTYDGLAIARAVVDYILMYLKSKTLFATHYHELTQMGNKKGIVNYNVLVNEHMNGVEFLHKVTKGSADKSYGIHVANLAGIPSEVITRANKILNKLEKKGKEKNRIQSTENIDSEQLEIFNASNHLVIRAIKKINIETITPIDALNELNTLKKLIE